MPSSVRVTTRCATGPHYRNGPKFSYSAGRWGPEPSRARAALREIARRRLQPQPRKIPCPGTLLLRTSEANRLLRPAVRSEVEAAYAECNAIARVSRSSFYLAFFGLRKEKRNALCALYAFMRLVDNVSDELAITSPSAAAWPVGVGCWTKPPQAAPRATRFCPRLPTQSPALRFPRATSTISFWAQDGSDGRVLCYIRPSLGICYRVAGTVGLTCLHVFGFRDGRAPDLAERLGLAFQLTNILRDVQADYEMGRIYLPLDDLARFGVCEQDLRGPLKPPFAICSRSPPIVRGAFMRKALRWLRKWTLTAGRLCGR